MRKIISILLVLFTTTSISQIPLELPPIEGQQKTYTCPKGWSNYSGSPDIVKGNGVWNPGEEYQMAHIEGDYPGKSMVWMMYTETGEDEGMTTTLDGLKQGEKYSVSVQWQQCAMMLGEEYMYKGAEFEMIVQGKSKIFKSEGLDDEWQKATVEFKANATSVDVVLLIHRTEILPDSRWGGCIVVDNLMDGTTETYYEEVVEIEEIEKPLDPNLDSDKDGIIDAEDFCEYEAGPVENNGCPWEDDQLNLRLFEPVYFGNAESDFIKVHEDELEVVALYLVDHPWLKIKISGHTDDQGSANDNLLLSKDRAEAVGYFLATYGVAKDRILIVYRGEELPVETNDTPEGRAQNRRVEMEVIFE